MEEPGRVASSPRPVGAVEEAMLREDVVRGRFWGG
jgi:hypothetical protein